MWTRPSQQVCRTKEKTSPHHEQHDSQVHVQSAKATNTHPFRVAPRIRHRNSNAQPRISTLAGERTLMPPPTRAMTNTRAGVCRAHDEGEARGEVMAAARAERAHGRCNLPLMGTASTAAPSAA